MFGAKKVSHLFSKAVQFCAPPASNSNNSYIKSSFEIEKMREAGRLTAKVLEAVADYIKPGITTLEIDRFCEHYIQESLEAKPGSKGQYGYQYTINTSLNHVVCHGMPDNRPLEESDIVNIDVTVLKDGYYGDSSKMFMVGNVSPEARRLVNITQECLYKGIRAIKPNSTLGDIGHAIQTHAEKNGYSVVREYCGHGIGRQLHEQPAVFHYGKPGKGMRLEPGMIFTIEPLINQGKKETEVLDDNWTVVTKDGSLSAQWEHTVLVTPHGFEILTLREEEKNSLLYDFA